jgi:hypothetical protein
VERTLVLAPDVGLDRGVWEAPGWTFFAAIAAVLVFGAIYLARRLGWPRRSKKEAP